MGMSAGSKGGANSEINVTPLVDVCLVLLIIFMVMVPRNVEELSVRLPPESKQKKPPRESDEKPVVLELSEEGVLSLNRKPLKDSGLGKEIARQLKFRSKKVVFVKFHDKTEYGRAVTLMDTAKAAGAEVVGIMREKDYVMPKTLR